MFSRIFLVGMATTFLLSLNGFASVGDRFGFTSESAALAGAKAGGSDFTSASAYENPAQLSLMPDTEGRTRFHWSLLYAAPSFVDIGDVVVENPVNSDKTNATSRSAPVDTNYPVTFGQSIGLSTQSQRSPYRWGLGAVVYLPLDRLALVDSGEAFVPEYSLHRGGTQKPEFQFAISALVAPNLSFGAGLQLGTKLTSETTLFLNQGAGTASSMRISASLKTQASPYFGLTYLPSEQLSVGVTARLASAQPQTLNVRSSARAIGTVSALSFSFPAISTLYYDPLTIQAGGEWKYTNGNAFFFQVDYQAWSKFESPAIVMLDPQTSSCSPSCGVDFSTGLDLSRKTRDLFIPRVGHVWTLGTNDLRIGYVYRPSIYTSLPTGAGNAIDPDEHRLATGMGWGFNSLWVFDAPGRLDLHASYSVYPKKHVDKTAGDETGDLTNRKVGDPGYDIGGSEWGTGLTVQLFL